MPFDGSNGDTDDPDLREISKGVRARDLKEGTGDPCPIGADVVIHYVGWTTDGNVFDSSRKKGKPASFKLISLIAGWQEGIPGMKVGGVRKLVIASDKGYGGANK
ncbi:MAG: FKBP-type peptidyl-prolyl cis-trans isomerase, partial [Gemmataceae bacterium]|nr:FKBP-type peptidyl-prolyl cis-trans isomerase [Gemmataceae bacterium]